jgi:hypothetical protein
MPRRERVKAILDALSPAGRERAWAALDDDQRADAVAVLFDATEERPRERPTFAGAYDRWQRETDR